MRRTAGPALRWLLLAVAAVGCATARPAQQVQAAGAALVASEALAGGRIGFAVLDLGTGEVVAEAAANRGFATASNMKLLSSAVALVTLGADFTMATDLVACGEIRDGVLDGDLVVRGHGDPTFGEGAAGDRAIATFLVGLQQLGIRRVAGRVLGDGSWQGPETLGLGWQWDYLDEDYAAPFGGLCYGGNVIDVHLRPGDAGPVLQLKPTTERLPAVAVVQGAAGSATLIEAHRALGSDLVVVSGTLAADAKEQVHQVAVRDPVRFAANAITGAMVAGGITIDGAELPASGSERVVASHASPPLGEIVSQLLTSSNNLYAEQVWRVAARVATGESGTAAAERHAKAVLADLGVDSGGMVLADGSGLSRRNLVQPHQIVRLLAAMYDSSHRETFLAGLPVAGRTGTLRSRFADGPAHGRVRAKTGFISRVVCLSGYVPRPDASAPPLAFCVMLNDFTCTDQDAKAAVDAFVQQLATAAGW